MTAIWKNDGKGWQLLPPTNFPDEATLHSLVEEAPQLLPLAGSPNLVVIGREVQLGSGFADLLAIEPNGRIALIEIKLARNAEARRAVVAQVLAYAAYLYELDPASLERDVLAKHLQQRGFDSLASAIADSDQTGQFDSEGFSEGLRESLADGRLRLVVVLDAAPDELVRLVGFLESVSDKLLIDLVAISSYRIEGSTIIVPQRVDPEHKSVEQAHSQSRAKSASGQLVHGADDFVAAIARASTEDQPALRRLANWASEMEKKGLCALSTYHGVAGRLTLLPRMQPENVGLVTIWHEKGAYLQFWRSVFERRAPNALAKLEAIATVKQGNTTREITDEMLHVLGEAYAEACGGTQETPMAK